MGRSKLPSEQSRNSDSSGETSFGRVGDISALASGCPLFQVDVNVKKTC